MVPFIPPLVLLSSVLLYIIDLLVSLEHYPHGPFISWLFFHTLGVILPI